MITKLGKPWLQFLFIWLTWLTVTVAVQSTQPAEAKPPVPGVDDPSLDRLSTLLSRCLQAGLPAETSQTATGAFRKTTFQNCDDSIGASTLVHAPPHTIHPTNTDWSLTSWKYYAIPGEEFYVGVNGRTWVSIPTISMLAHNWTIEKDYSQAILVGNQIQKSMNS